MSATILLVIMMYMSDVTPEKNNEVQPEVVREAELPPVTTWEQIRNIPGGVLGFVEKKLTGFVLRTSQGPDRIELSPQNELGFPAEGLYLYKDGKIVTALTQNTVFFYDNTGTLRASIQMPVAGVISIGTNTKTVEVGETYMRFSGAGIPDFIMDEDGIYIGGLPTSTSGLGSGQLWHDTGDNTIKITP